MNRDMRQLRDEARQFKPRSGRRRGPYALALAGLTGAVALEIALAGEGGAWFVAVPFLVIAAWGYHQMGDFWRGVYADAVPDIQARGLVPEGWKWNERRERAAINHQRGGELKTIIGISGMFGMCVFGVALIHRAVASGMLGGDSGGTTVIPLSIGGKAAAYTAAAPSFGAAGWLDGLLLAVSFVLACWGAWRLMLGLLRSFAQAGGRPLDKIAAAAAGGEPDAFAEASKAQSGARIKDLAWVWGHDPSTAEGFQAMIEIGRIFVFWATHERAQKGRG